MTASFLSRMSFCWLDELVWKAFRATLEVPDLYPLSEEHKSETIAREVSSISSANLLRRLWQLIKYDALALGGWAAVNSVAVYISPALIRVFLTHLDVADETAWLCVGGFLAGGILAGTADCQCEWKSRQTSAKVRAVLISEIYAKVLRKRITRSTSREDGAASDGGIFNLMSVDAESVSAVSGDLYFVWVTFPVQTGIGTWLLYRLLGTSGVLGVLAMVLLLPLNFLVARRVMAVQAQVLTASDKRIHATNDVLNNLRTIKYSAWVQPFMKRVLSKRSVEINELRARCIWWSVNMTTFHALPFVVTMITLFLYTVVWGGSLRTSTAFPALAIFGIIRIPLDRMASSASFMMRAYVSLSRIESFLLERETGKYQQLGASDSASASDYDYDSDSDRIGFENATLSWPSSVVGTSAAHTSREDIFLTTMPASPFRLDNLNIAFQTNALNIICGPSGAGKSSLLLSLLGEMDLLNGCVFLAHDENPSSSSSLSNTTAYCPQDPWIMNRSIRDNILMEQPFDGPRYERVLHATALQLDLATLDHGDLALAGEGGRRLSGGQKQRIALARALYSPCKCVLLDDCLSAVDASTANHVFFHGIKGLLMRGRTCILATHAVQLVTPYCGYVVVLDEGRAVGQGTPEKVISEGLVARDHVDTSSTQAHIDSATLGYSVEANDKPRDVESQSTYTETKAEGKVTWAVIRTYLTTMGKQSYWIPVLIMFGAQQIAALGTSLWVKQWASE
jgi:ABC-type multidrug transport system fused ATPase/permease subunit